MNSLTQISIFAQNKPGKLEKVTAALAAAGVNILAVAITGAEGFGIIKLIVDDSAAAERALNEGGFTFSREKILAVGLVDRPGGLHAVVQALARNGVNIENAHIFIPDKREKAYLVVEVDDAKATKKILEREGLDIL